MTEFASSTITEITKALLKAQNAMPPIAKDAVNSYLCSRYPSLAAVLDAVRRPLLDNNIVIVQRPVASEPGTAAVETRLIHSSGEWYASVTTIPLPNVEPSTKSANAGQAVGAAISYARRYGLMAMLSLAAEDVDNELREPQSPQQPKPRFQPPQARQQDQPAPTSSATARAEYPGLPNIPDVQYEESKDAEGRDVVLARGATLQHKESLKKCGFRWSPERKAWWITT